MSDTLFLQYHTLTSYPGTLLNRDDAGFAKVLPFGNAKRTRVSSQCLKYHWRSYEGEHSLRDVADMSVRSRHTFRKKIAEPVVEEGLPERATAAVTYALSQMVLNGETTKSEIRDNAKSALDNDDPLSVTDLDRIVVFGEAEVDYLKSVAKEALEGLKEEDYDPESEAETSTAVYNVLRDNDLRSNLRALGNAMGLDAAMFGRMVTSDILAQGDAAVHVAHAITTHKQKSENDYFTAVDELKDEDTGGTESGAALIQSKELTSGLFYGYIVVDVPLLVSNLEGCPREDWKYADHELTEEVLRRFTKMLGVVSPGAKLSSTAPYSRSEFLMVESGQVQPRTLANAFKEAVDGEDLLEESVQALTDYTERIDGMYGKNEERVVATIAQADAPAEPTAIDDIADNWIPSQIAVSS
ncbi:MAG: type I-E CRISPR-associated protein Cas7/Cse4/CasC [Salinibacter sp.]